jgi:hypothetical protein
LIIATLVSCGGGSQSPSEQAPTPAPTIPLPTAGLAGQRVSLYPVTLIAAEDSLGWHTLIRDRRATLARGDSLVAALLTARAPEVSWILPADLRRSARRAVGIATDPDQMGTSILRDERLVIVPDPLRTQFRSLNAIAGDRFAVVPAAILYRRKAGGPNGQATAEVSMVMVDVRTARVVWRTVARGDGPDPWASLTAAVKSLTPGLP